MAMLNGYMLTYQRVSKAHQGDQKSSSKHLKSTKDFGNRLDLAQTVAPPNLQVSTKNEHSVVNRFDPRCEI